MQIEINHLSKHFDEKQVLIDFSESFSVGITSLLSPSGSGKTTLLRLIAGLDTPDSGTIGLPVDYKLSVLFQEDRLLPTLTALENIEIVLKDDKRPARYWLERMGLSAEANKRPSDLSGGMCRRIALARALAYDGTIFLLDEPFKGLDMQGKRSVMELVRDHLQEKIVLLVTHDLDEALFCSHRIVVAGGIPFTKMSDCSIPIPYNQRNSSSKEFDRIADDLLKLI